MITVTLTIMISDFPAIITIITIYYYEHDNIMITTTIISDFPAIITIITIYYYEHDNSYDYYYYY